MDIHQMQVTYDARADRLLWQIRSRDGAWYGVWLTRRMVTRLWPPFQGLIVQAGMARVVSQDALVVPEAREMMAEAARHRPLPGADFNAPFEATSVASRPLGQEPLLPDLIDLTPVPAVQGKGLFIKIREAGGRSLEMKLGDDLSTALMRLLERALAGSEWFPPVPPPDGAAGAPEKTGAARGALN